MKLDSKIPEGPIAEKWTNHKNHLKLVAIVSWNQKYIKVTAFALTFIAVVVGIHLLAKFFTSIVDFAYLGWLNKLAGALFSVLKTILALSVVFNIFQKINMNNLIVKKETLDTSIFYSPIQDISQFIYPTLEEWYMDFKNNEDKGE